MGKIKKAKKLNKTITYSEKAQLNQAIKESTEQLFNSKEFGAFYKQVFPKAKSWDQNHNCNKIVPFRWRHILLTPAKDKNKFCYYLDPTIKDVRHHQDNVHYKLYYDVVEWFWNNADEVCDYKEEYPRLKVNTSNRKLLSKPTDINYPLYNISHFSTNGNLEFINHDLWVILYLTSARASKLNSWLTTKGWQKHSVVCPEECPGFLKKSKDQKDNIVILNSLIEWHSYNQKDRDKIINHYVERGFKYYSQSKLMKVQQCNRKLLLKPCDFIKFNKNNEEGGYYLIA